MLGDLTGRLKCSATGDPAPTLFWIQPNGRTSKYSPSTTGSVAAAAPVGLAPSTAGLPGAVEDGARRTDGVLLLGGRSPMTSSAVPLTGMYICVANNEAGNVTLAVNISWPPVQRPRPTTKIVPSDEDSLLDDEAAYPVNFTLTEDEWLKRERGGARLFSVTELVCAVVVTHIATLLIVLALVVVFVHRRAAHRRRQQQLLPPVHSVPAPVPTPDPDPRLLRTEPVHASVGGYRHNGYQLPGMTGRTTPYANDGLYESGTMRSGFSYTASNRR